jgi:hypothetical protein
MKIAIELVRSRSMITDAMLEARSERRQQLRARGYMPIPLFGKVPPLKEWQKLSVISRDMINLWNKVWPDADNTGILTRNTPALDIDIRNEAAARAVEDLVRERFEERGWILVRIGQPPKRAVIFFSNTPFRKITAPLIAPNGSKDEKIELLCDGQQLVIDGIHPSTAQPYRWHGGEPWTIARDQLPYLHPHEAQQLVEDAAKILTTDFGYSRTPTRSLPTGRGIGNLHCHGANSWHALIENILLGNCLHDSLRDLASMLAASGMNSGAATHLLQALVEQIELHDARVEARLRDLPRAVDSAYAKYSKR